MIAAKTSVGEDDIRAYINQTAFLRKQQIEELEDQKSRIMSSVSSWSEEKKFSWAQEQCYIVLGTLLLAAADAKIDACPMGGFEPEKYNHMLGLKEHGLHATVIAAIGYRSIDDDYQHAIKSRRDLDDIVELRYS